MLFRIAEHYYFSIGIHTVSLDFSIDSQLGNDRVERRGNDGDRRCWFLSCRIFLNRIKEPAASLERFFGGADGDTDSVAFFQPSQIFLEDRRESALFAKRLRLQLVIHIDLQGGSLGEGLVAQVAVVNPDFAGGILRERVGCNVEACYAVLVPHRGDVERAVVDIDFMAGGVGLQGPVFIHDPIPSPWARCARLGFLNVGQRGVALGISDLATGIPKKAPARRRSFRHGCIPVNREGFPRPVGMGDGPRDDDQRDCKSGNGLSSGGIRSEFRHRGFRF